MTQISDEMAADFVDAPGDLMQCGSCGHMWLAPTAQLSACPNCNPESFAAELIQEIASLRRALTAALAVAPAGGGGDTVEVRVAVAMDRYGQTMTSKLHEGEDEALVWGEMASCGYPIMSCIATLHAPRPSVAEVAAEGP